MKCNLVLCLREEQLILYLSCEGCKKSIMLKEKKLHVCFVDLEKVFDKVPWKVLEWALRKKEIPEFWLDQ